jgi:hypothetical protein
MALARSLKQLSSIALGELGEGPRDSVAFEGSAV